MMTAGGEIAVNLYRVGAIYILGTGPINSEDIDFAKDRFGPFSCPLFDATDKPHKALIGRNMLSRGMLTLSWDGRYTFSF